MKKVSTIFDRILILIEKKGLKNVAELANLLGYGSPQKIYRLRQAENSKPSYDIIHDFSNKFEDLNLRWFITGEGEPFKEIPASKNIVTEPNEAYKVSDEIERLKNKIAELEIEKRALLLALREIGSGHSAAKDNVDDSDEKKSN